MDSFSMNESYDKRSVIDEIKKELSEQPMYNVSYQRLIYKINEMEQEIHDLKAKYLMLSNDLNNLHNR